MQKALLFLLFNYKRFVSPVFKIFFGNACRFYPTCSEYSYAAVKHFGVKKGVVLSMKRFLKCNPYSKPGFDPLPSGA